LAECDCASSPGGSGRDGLNELFRFGFRLCYSDAREKVLKRVCRHLVISPEKLVYPHYYRIASELRKSYGSGSGNGSGSVSDSWDYRPCYPARQRSCGYRSSASDNSAHHAVCRRKVNAAVSHLITWLR
jgi:hypothetical protein